MLMHAIDKHEIITKLWKHLTKRAQKNDLVVYGSLTIPWSGS
jgi:hypothetical protein